MLSELPMFIKIKGCSSVVLLTTVLNSHMALMHMDKPTHILALLQSQPLYRSQYLVQSHLKVMYLKLLQVMQDRMNSCSGHIKTKRALFTSLVHLVRRDYIKILIQLVRFKHLAHLQVQDVLKILLGELLLTAELGMSHSPTLELIQVKVDSCYQHAIALRIETIQHMYCLTGTLKAQMTKSTGLSLIDDST